MPLVEIVTHDQTPLEVAATAMRFVQGIGKTPVLVRDRPGFVVNRILMPYLLGAVQRLSQAAEIEPKLRASNEWVNDPPDDPWPAWRLEIGRAHV